MLLKKITLNNFRQFYGEQNLDIAYGTEKNVTLIHAENGVGKTAILNAILWCFYEELTARFEHPNKIANYQAISEGDYSVKVEVIFESDKEEYLVSRSLNEHSGDKEFKAFLVKSGSYKPLPAPDVFINSVIPREMARYFFFDGEYAESFSSQNNKSTVKTALENMLGCSTANQAVDDLKSLIKKMQRNLTALTKGKQSEIFQKQIDNFTAANISCKADLERCLNNLAAAKDARDEIIKELRNSEGASGVQKNRENLEEERKQILKSKNAAEAELTRWISDSGLGLISRSLEEKTQKMLEDAKNKGKIPSYIAETFVRDILNTKNCICDRDFEEDSNEAEAIRKLTQDAGSATATDRLMDARSLMGRLAEKRSHAIDNSDRIKEQIKGCTAELDVIESRIADCGSKLENIQEVAEKEIALNTRNEEIEEWTGKTKGLEHKISEYKKDLNTAREKRDQALKGNAIAEALQYRCKLLDKTISQIEDELVTYRKQSRETIGEKVNQILDTTARRDYSAEIDEKFNLDMLHKETGASVARSGGENQLLSLSFIAALIQFSAARMEDPSKLLKPGTSAPMVLDSPFGQLDPTYQKSTADFLPLMAGQVILLLSQTQGNPDVMNILRKKIGKEYILVSENKGPQGDKPSDELSIKDKVIKCSRYKCEKDQTRILRV